MFNPATAAAAAIALSLAAAGAAHADAYARDAVLADVQVHGVDFQQSPSVKGLYARLERAAWSVCDSRINDREARRADAACRRQAIDSAVARLSKPMLTAMHQTRSQTLYARGY
jgi:UrcA family protein